MACTVKCSDEAITESEPTPAMISGLANGIRASRIPRHLASFSRCGFSDASYASGDDVSTVNRSARDAASASICFSRKRSMPSTICEARSPSIVSDTVSVGPCTSCATDGTAVRIQTVPIQNIFVEQRPVSMAGPPVE